MPDHNDPVAEAMNEIAQLKEREHEQRDQIKVLEMHEDNPDSRSADEWKVQFEQAEITGVLSRGEPDSAKITTKIAKLKTHLQRTQGDLTIARSTYDTLVEQMTMEAQQRRRGTELATAVQKLQSRQQATESRQQTTEMDRLKACFLEQGSDSVSDSASVLSGDTRASTMEIADNKKHIRELLGTKCMVCGSEKDVAVAHILKKASHCQSFGVTYYNKNSQDMSNWLMLCGRRGKGNTCHHLFDSYEMGFCMKDRRWYAYGGVKDGEQVTLRSNPHRTVLQAHLALVMKHLGEKEQVNEAVLAWSKDVSQSTGVAERGGA